MFRALLVGLTAMLALSACSSSQPESSPLDIPAWYSMIEHDDEFYYGFGEAKATNLGSADRMARLEARAQLAESISSDIRALTDQGVETDFETGQTMGVASDAMEAAVSARLQGAELDQIERVRQPDGSIQVYVRMRMPREQAEAVGQSALDYMRENVAAPGGE